MFEFTRISQEAFKEIQVNAGLLLKKFDPTGNTKVEDADIVTATTGGINASCVPTYTDWGADIDNCPDNVLELKHLDSWLCKLACTGLGTSPAYIKMALGAADIDTTNASKITPRGNLQQGDFADVWWVGDRVDGGMVAVRLMNALSTSGFTLQTTKKGKGQTTIELTGHVSIADPNIVPMEFYSTAGEVAAE